MNHSHEIVSTFDKILNEKICYNLCRQYKFIERSSSKLKGSEFIKTMILPSKGLTTDSLKGLCKRIQEFNPEANLSAQALCERINHISASELMKGVFAAILLHSSSKMINRCPQLTKRLEHFDAILIEDSTVVKLNGKLETKFKGTSRGGKEAGAKSQAKIDLIYNLMDGTMVNAEIYSGKEPDQGLASRIIKYVKAGDLIIRDLGYFVLKSIKSIVEIAAYFLSRLQPNVKIYLKKEDIKPLDLGKYVEAHYPRHGIIDIEQVFLGDEKMPARLILYRQPQEITEKRRREANKRAKETGRTMSQGKKLCLKFAIFVTNAPKELLAAEIIGTVYRLRWEIELIFKRWKSQLEVDYLQGIDENRIECLIWSRLCMIVIIEIIEGYISRIAQKQFVGREVSHVRLIDYVLRESKFCEAIAKARLDTYLEEMEKDIVRMLLKDKRMRKTMRERVSTNESYYGIQRINNQEVA